MRTEPDNGHLPLQCARDAEQVLPLSGIGPTFVEVRQDPSRTFEPEYRLTVEAHRRYLGLQLIRTMEIRRREVIPLVRRVSVLSLLQVLLHNRRESGVGKQIPGNTIER